MNFKQSLFTGVACVAFAGSVFAGDKTEGASKADSKKLLDPANMDLSVRPGDNFFYYANGAWLKKNAIPASETRWGSFNELQENNYKALHELLEQAASDEGAEHNSPTWKVGAFFRSGMNSDAINAAGLKPLQPSLDRINDSQVLIALTK